MTMLPVFDVNHVTQLANVLADTVTHANLTELFHRLGVDEPTGEGSKANRIRHGLAGRQQRDRCGNIVGAFIQGAADPVRYTANPQQHDDVRERLNRVLAFSGMSLGEDGKLRAVTRATTLSEAEERASKLSRKLSERGVHADVLKFCRPELVDGNYFHAVMEATKSIAEKVRARTGLVEDGAELMQRAFRVKHALLAINSLTTPTLESEQNGFINLLTGIFGMFRNPPAHTAAHAPNPVWSIDENDALDLLVMVSYAHRRIDKAARTHLSP